MHLLPPFLLIPFLLSLILATNQDILIGPSLTFNPNTTYATPGSKLTFHFFPGRHNVAKSLFSTPCIPSPNGFYSGFIVPESGEANQTFVVTVNDTEPIWFYCSEFMHCQLGMVGVVNPPATGASLEAYAAAAAKTINSTTPAAVAGGVFSSLNPSSTPSSTAAESGSPASTSTASPTPSVSEGIVLAGSGGNLLLNGIAAVVVVAALWAGLV